MFIITTSNNELKGNEMGIKQLLIKHQSRIINIKHQVMTELETAPDFEKALAMENKIGALNHKISLINGEYYV